MPAGPSPHTLTARAGGSVSGAFMAPLQQGCRRRQAPAISLVLASLLLIAAAARLPTAAAQRESPSPSPEESPSPSPSPEESPSPSPSPDESPSPSPSFEESPSPSPDASPSPSPDAGPPPAPIQLDYPPNRNADNQPVLTVTKANIEGRDVYYEVRCRLPGSAPSISRCGTDPPLAAASRGPIAGDTWAPRLPSRLPCPECPPAAPCPGVRRRTACIGPSWFAGIAGAWPGAGPAPSLAPAALCRCPRLRWACMCSSMVRPGLPLPAVHETRTTNAGARTAGKRSQAPSPGSCPPLALLLARFVVHCRRPLPTQEASCSVRLWPAGCAHNGYDHWPPQPGCEECRGARCRAAALPSHLPGRAQAAAWPTRRLRRMHARHGLIAHSAHASPLRAVCLPQARPLLLHARRARRLTLPACAPSWVQACPARWPSRSRRCPWATPS